jgi:hypothetical protein
MGHREIDSSVFTRIFGQLDEAKKGKLNKEQLKQFINMLTKKDVRP